MSDVVRRSSASRRSVRVAGLITSAFALTRLARSGSRRPRVATRRKPTPARAVGVEHRTARCGRTSPKQNHPQVQQRERGEQRERRGTRHRARHAWLPPPQCRARSTTAAPRRAERGENHRGTSRCGCASDGPESGRRLRGNETRARSCALTTPTRACPASRRSPCENARGAASLRAQSASVSASERRSRATGTGRGKNLPLAAESATLRVADRGGGAEASCAAASGPRLRSKKTGAYRHRECPDEATARELLREERRAARAAASGEAYVTSDTKTSEERMPRRSDATPRSVPSGRSKGVRWRDSAGSDDESASGTPVSSRDRQMLPRARRRGRALREVPLGGLGRGPRSRDAAPPVEAARAEAPLPGRRPSRCVETSRGTRSRASALRGFARARRGGQSRCQIDMFLAWGTCNERRR